MANPGVQGNMNGLVYDKTICEPTSCFIGMSISCSSFIEDGIRPIWRSVQFPLWIGFIEWLYTGDEQENCQQKTRRHCFPSGWMGSEREGETTQNTISGGIETRDLSLLFSVSVPLQRGVIQTNCGRLLVPHNVCSVCEIMMMPWGKTNLFRMQANYTWSKLYSSGNTNNAIYQRKKGIKESACVLRFFSLLICKTFVATLLLDCWNLTLNWLLLKFSHFNFSLLTIYSRRVFLF